MTDIATNGTSTIISGPGGADSTAIVLGVGAVSGLGAALARRFASEGLRVFVTGRTEAKLQAVADLIRQAGGAAEVRVTDVTREQDVVALFEETGANLELVAYNVGNNRNVPFLELSGQLVEEVWRENALGGFFVGRESIRHMLLRGRGTILYTGATASLRARPPFTAFASSKAALRAFAQGIAREFGPNGIHVAHIIVDGVIGGDRARQNFAKFVEAKGEDGLLNIDDIADAYWTLHKQPRSAWTHELDLRPFKESF